MDIHEIISKASNLRVDDSDPDLQKLVRLAKAAQKHLDDVRSGNSYLAAKPEDEILEEISGAIENSVGFSMDDAREAYRRVFEGAQQKSIVSALPMLLRLRGKPYTLEDHYPMEPIFRTELPVQYLLRCGRQVSKSTTFAAQGVVQSGCSPFFNSLFVTPLFEQCRRFSSNYVRPFINDSPIYHAIVDRKCEQSVLQRSFTNRSVMYFSYCLKDADRIRGISADKVSVDEVQDIDWDLLPIILETMSASDLAILQASGTPKTLDNTIEYLWHRTSQAEWVTRCTACNYWNIAALAHDLLRMIGKKTVVCARCSRPINPRPASHPKPEKRGTGFWLHAFPDRIVEFPGYHAPQVIFPMHFANPRKWRLLLQKMDPSHTPRHVFVNEVLGEGADAGTKLVTQNDIVRACKVYNRPNKVREALQMKQAYLDVAVGVDWGGSTAPYGTGRAHLLLKPEAAQSYTVLAIVGLKASGKVDVLYLFRFDLVGNHSEEARACLRMWSQIDEGRQSTLFCHDFGGAGSVRETLMIQAGLPPHAVFGCVYAHAPQMKMLEPSDKGGRLWWTVDKARSLIFLCQALKNGFIGLPEFESSKHLVKDFLALMEDTVERPGSCAITRVIRKPGVPDDAVHAINVATLGLWQRHGYPNFKDILSMEDTLARLRESAQAVSDDSPTPMELFDDPPEA